MSNLPAVIPAPVPVECDLRGYDWFPLFHKRLRRSSFWKNASDTVARISVDFWCESYEQVPAASLPDDDAFLSEVAGYGRRDLKAWRAVKDDVMQAWLLIGGRWYHPVLCEVAIVAWDRRKRELEERDAARVRKQKSRVAKSNVTRDEPSGHNSGGDGHVGQSEAERDVTRETPLTETETRTETKKEDAPDGALFGCGRGEDVGDGGAEPKAAAKPSPQDAFDAYNAAAGQHGWAVAKGLTDKRRKKLQARLKEHGLEVWIAALERASHSPFLMSRVAPSNGHRQFHMDLDFLTQPESFQRLIEGYYDDTGTGADGRDGRRTAHLRAVHEAAMGLGDADY